MAADSLEPDLLDRLGYGITEIGAVQVAIELAQRYADGSVRVSVLVQTAYAGALSAQLRLEIPAQPSLERTVALDHAEVRRARFDLPNASEAPLSLSVRAAIPAGAARVRPSWVRESDDRGSSSGDGTLWDALGRAFGRRPQRQEPRAPEEGTLSISLGVGEGERPLAALDELVWQPGMDLPKEGALTVPGEAPRPPLPEQPVGERPECPYCFERQWLEQIRQSQSCPSCGRAWLV